MGDLGLIKIKVGLIDRLGWKKKYKAESAYLNVGWYIWCASMIVCFEDWFEPFSLKNITFQLSMENSLEHLLSALRLVFLLVIFFLI